MKKLRQRRGFSIAPETMKAIKLKAIESNYNDSDALDTIVQEWIEFKEKKWEEVLEPVLDDAALLKELEELTGTSYNLQTKIDTLRDRLLSKTLDSEIENAPVKKG